MTSLNIGPLLFINRIINYKNVSIMLNLYKLQFIRNLWKLYYFQVLNKCLKILVQVLLLRTCVEKV